MADVINPRDLLLANAQRNLPVEIPHSAMKGTALSNPTMGVIANLMEDLHAKSSPETSSQTLGRIFLRYKETLAAVRVGDIASRGALPAIAKEYIEQARKYYASSSHYQEIYKSVVAELEMLLEPQQTPVSSIQNLTSVIAAPVVGVGTSVGVEPDKAGLLPVEQGLSTKDIAHAFDGVNGWSVDRWTRNLSAAKWLHPARIALGGAGGASSVWNPVMLAQLMHDSAKGEREKEKLMKVFNSRFTLNPALGLWRDAFNEYFATHCATD